MPISYTLSIDTATGPCSVAVLADREIIAECREEGNIQQAKKILPMIEDALKHAGIGYDALESIVSTVGPGGFTGLRIGLATARAIGFAGNIPVKGVSTLAALAYATRASKLPVLALLNGGKGEAYFQLFETVPVFRPLLQPQLGGLDKIMTVVRGVGYTAVGYTQALKAPPSFEANVKSYTQSQNIFPQAPASGGNDVPHLPTHPDAAHAGLLAISHPELILAPEPLYIRPPDAIPAKPVASTAEPIIIPSPKPF